MVFQFTNPKMQMVSEMALKGALVRVTRIPSRDTDANHQGDAGCCQALIS